MAQTPPRNRQNKAPILKQFDEVARSISEAKDAPVPPAAQDKAAPLSAEEIRSVAQGALEPGQSMEDADFSSRLQRALGRLGVTTDQVEAALNAEEQDEQRTKLVWDQDLDEGNGDWRPATESEMRALAAGEGHTLEPEDRENHTLLDIHVGGSGYDPEYHYRWVNIHHFNRANLSAYRPVRRSKMQGHILRNIPGIGQVVSYNDVALFRTSKEYYEKRKKAEDKRNRYDYADFLNESREQVKEQLKEKLGKDLKGFYEDEDAEEQGTTIGVDPNLINADQQLDEGAFDSLTEQTAAAHMKALGVTQDDVVAAARRGGALPATRMFGGYNGRMAKFTTEFEKKRLAERGF